MLPLDYPKQLEWIRQIHQSIGSPWMNQFFIGWSYVDSFGFVLLVVGVVWWLFDRKVGVKLLYLFFISSITNIFFKELLGQPRPCQIDPSIGLLCSKSNGLPSGAAQSAILYAGVLWKECKNKGWRLFGILFALMFCFSRVYLGVHFPTDIIGGLIIGAVLLLFYWYIFDLAKKNWKKWSFLVTLFPLILLREQGIPFTFSLLGIAIGLMLYERVQGKRSLSRSLCWWGLFATLVGVVFLRYVGELMPAYKEGFGFLAGLWFSFLGGWIVQTWSRLCKKNFSQR